MKGTHLTVTVMALALVLFMAAGSLFAADYQITKKAGQYGLDVRFDRNPPVAGKNSVAIGIKDRAGKVITDAGVAIEYSMPAMPGMPAMSYKTTATLKGEKYVAVLDLSMSGAWNIVLRITRSNQTQTARFTIDAR